MCRLMGKINPETMKLDCGPNKVLEINREVVHHILEFPMGTRTAPKHAESVHDNSLANMKDTLGLNRSCNIDVKDLLNLLGNLVNNPEKVDMPVKVFFLIVFQSLLCPSPATRLSRVAAMVENLNFDSMAEMDFCQLVVNELQAAVYKWNSEGSKQNYAEGCTIMPPFMYLYSLNLRNVFCYAYTHATCCNYVPSGVEEDSQRRHDCKEKDSSRYLQVRQVACMFTFFSIFMFCHYLFF